MQHQDPLSPVGKTALGVAKIRGEESRRPDRLFEDPYAEAFVAAAPGVLPDWLPDDRMRADFGFSLVTHVAIRTRFFDDYLLDACAHGCRQVVLLAAGLDARAFRLDWPSGVRLFEVDRRDVLGVKRQVLQARSAAPRCTRTVVEADLSGEWTGPLTAAGFDPATVTAWLVEGLLIYLTADEARRLFSAVGELSAAGSRLACEQAPGMLPEEMVERARDIPEVEDFLALWKGGMGDEAPAWLDGHGWSVTTVDQAEITRAYGREAAELPGGFLTAIRTDTA